MQNEIIARCAGSVGPSQAMIQPQGATFRWNWFFKCVMASMRRRPTLRLAGAMILCVACSAPTFAGQPAEMIAGVVARSKTIASGRISYTFKSESFVGPRALSPIALPEVTTSFSDSSWAELSKTSHFVRINHDGYFLEFVQTPQRNGSVRPGATLYPQRPLENRAELNAPPIFAGSFWYREQLRYVEEHSSDFRNVDSGIVNAVPVDVLELAVAAEDHREAFHILLPALKSGGTIRLYVAPQFGFVLPRIEFLTPSKQVAQSYDATDFSDVAPGIHFPQRVWNETHLVGGANRYRGEFSIRCELLNQPIPEDDFAVELPPGTRIQDAREPGNVIKFELTEASSSATLRSRRSSWELGRSFGVFDRWGNAVIVGLLIGTVTSISFLLAARNQRSHG